MESNMPFNKKSKFIFVTLMFMLLLGIAVSSAFAATITWSGNGTTSGRCNTVTRDTSVTQGQQRWLFILTSPMSSGPYLLTTNFSPATQTPSNPITGVKMANGAVHFTVYTSEGATLV